MSQRNSETRTALLASWEAARKQADRNGAILLNAASFAGCLLEQAGGLVPLAIELMPRAGDSLFYARVIAALQSVEAEERTPVVAPPAASAVRTC